MGGSWCKSSIPPSDPSPTVALVATQQAQVAKSVVVPALAASAVDPKITIIVLPPAASPVVWQGWGTSLCWWAMGLGDKEYLADLFFTTKSVEVRTNAESSPVSLPGLGLNIARYCIGGSSSKLDHEGSAMVNGSLDPKKSAKDREDSKTKLWKQTQGFWIDWSPNNDMYETTDERYWDWGVDEKQLQMLRMAQDRGADQREAFSNAPMWWMLRNKSPFGNPKEEDNLMDNNHWNFAYYLVAVVEHLRKERGITITSVEPFNEPAVNMDWGADGGAGQERCGFSTNLQALILGYLAQALEKKGLLGAVVIASSDENRPDEALKTWWKLWEEKVPKNTPIDNAQLLCRRLNTHAYDQDKLDDSKLAQVKDAVRTSSKPPALWMSEWDSAAEDKTNHVTGETLAKGIHRHVHHMGVVGWVLWQVVDEKWGVLRWNLNNKDARPDDFAEEIYTKKYHTYAHFTRHIRPGMEILDTGDAYVVAYGAEDRQIAVVISNFDTSAREVALELRGFQISGSTQRWRTNFTGDDTYTVDNDIGPEGEKNTLQVTLSPKTIMSFRIEKAMRVSKESP